MISRFNSITQANIQTPPHKQQNKNLNPNFKGVIDTAVQGGTQLLNSLNTNPAVGACFIDFFSMVLPRTLTDFSRGKDAGMETGIRESSGTLNHGLAGFVGLAAGYGVSYAFNKANDVKAHLVFTNNNTIDTFGAFMQMSGSQNGYNKYDYYYNIAKNAEFFNPSSAAASKEGFVKLKDETAKEFAKLMSDADTSKYKTPKDVLKKAEFLITGETGASTTVRIKKPDTLLQKGFKAEKYLEGELKSIITDSFSLGKAILDKASHDKTALVKDLGEYLGKIKGLKKATAVAGLAVPIAIGMSTQPINRYLTKKRTGSDGFVGVEGREPDKTKGFKIAKIMLGLAMGAGMVSTILKKPAMLFTNPAKAGAEILSRLQYKGLVPTIDQFKFIYGMTIMSRIFAVRDKNEMRESAIKDTLGFANWLILGGFVSKIAAKLFNKDTLNYDKSLNRTGWKNKIKNSYIFKGVEKSHEEILYPALKKLGINVLDENGKAIPFRTLLSNMKAIAKSPEASQEIKNLAEQTSKRLKVKNYQQLIGYAYSGLVLGLGIAKLNIAITNHIEGKNKRAALGLDKMKLSNDFIKHSAQESKTFGAFLNQI